MFDEEAEEPDHDEYDFEIELSMSDDGLVTTLTCHASRPLSPSEFAQAIRDYSSSLEILEHVSTETRH